MVDVKQVDRDGLKAAFDSDNVAEKNIALRHAYDVIGCLEARIAELERERDALKADKQRLDFLDECNRRLNARYGTKYRWALILNHNVTRLMLGHMDVDLHDSQPNGLQSCRDAIDEAARNAADALKKAGR